MIGRIYIKYGSSCFGAGVARGRSEDWELGGE